MASGPATLQIPIRRGCFTSRFDTSLPFILQGIIEEERWEMTVDQVNKFIAFSKRFAAFLFGLLGLALFCIAMIPVFADRIGTDNDALTYLFICEGLSLLITIVMLVAAVVRARRIQQRIDAFLSSENETFYHSAGVDISFHRFWFKMWVLQIQVRPVHQQKAAQVSDVGHIMGYPPMMAMPVGDGTALNGSYPMAVFASYPSVPGHMQYYAAPPQHQEYQVQQ